MPAPLSLAGAAAAGPDHRTVTSWQEAFHYPVPAIQKLERQLRQLGNENHDKLRSLAGASYRELLGTADLIVGMEERSREVDGEIEAVLSQCSVERTGRWESGWAKIGRGGAPTVSNGLGMAFVSQLAILQACPGAISRLLRAKSFLLAAKVYVFASFLRKSVAGAPDPPPFLTDTIPKALAGARRKLCSRIDAALTDPGYGIPEVVDMLVAYSLATFSTPMDTYMYFHRVRANTVLQCLAVDEGGEEDEAAVPDKKAALKAVSLWIKTVRQSYLALPLALIRSFKTLSLKPLVDDTDIQEIHELRMDMYLRFVPPEILSLTPLVQLDTISEEECVDRLRKWVGETQELLFTALGEYIERTGTLNSTIEEVISSREEVIRDWLQETGYLARTIKPEYPLHIEQLGILQKLRASYQKAIDRVLFEKASSLFTFTNSVLETLGRADKVSEPVPRLWDAEATRLSLVNGGLAFKQAVIRRVLGRSDCLDMLAADFAAWIDDMGRVKAELQRMRKHRWTSELADLLLDANKRDSTQEMQVALSTSDPDAAIATLDQELQTQIDEMQKRVSAAVEEATEQIAGGDTDLGRQRGIFLIRAIRIIQAGGTRATFMPTLLHIDTAKPLYRVLAKQLAEPSLSKLTGTVKRLLPASERSRARRRYVTPDLWDDRDGLVLPSSPSLPAYSLLQGLCGQMAALGTDLWVADARREARAVFREALEAGVADVLAEAARLLPAADAAASAEQPGPTEESEEPEERAARIQQVMMVFLFDVCYLLAACGDGGAKLEGGVVGRLADQAGLGGTSAAAATERVGELAGAYWGRTAVLFSIMGC